MRIYLVGGWYAPATDTVIGGSLFSLAGATRAAINRARTTHYNIPENVSVPVGYYIEELQVGEFTNFNAPGSELSQTLWVLRLPDWLGVL